MSDKKYSLPRPFNHLSTNPTWRNVFFPAIVVGTWFLCWKWAKVTDNHLDWNNFKLHSSQQARQALGMEDHIEQVGAYSNSPTHIEPYIPGPKSKISVVNQPPEQGNNQKATYHHPKDPERFRD